MIQRIQSVYLLLGAAALAGLVFLDSLWQSAAAATYSWFGPSIAGLSIATAVVGLIAIFLYNTRPLQRKVVLGTQMGTVITVAVLYGTLYLTGGFDVRAADGSFDTGQILLVALPVVAYVLFYLARRGIESDIELVKSMDRLR